MVILTGSVGYYLLFMGEPKIIDCIYMTVISITTVGYGEYDLLVLGARHETEEIEFNPSPERLLDVGLTLIVMGEVDNIVSARKVF